MCTSCRMGNAYSEVTKPAMSLTNHSQQAANTMDTGCRTLCGTAVQKTTAFLHLHQPASPATPKHSPSLSSFGSKGKLRFIKKVRKITLVINSISAAILKLPRFYIKQ